MTKVPKMSAPTTTVMPSPIPKHDQHDTQHQHEQTKEHDITETKRKRFPDIKLRIHLDDISHVGFARFQTIPIAKILQEAIDNVEQHLYTKPLSTSRPQKPISHWSPQEVRSITLKVYGMDGVAYTTGTALDEAHKEIHFSLNHARNNEGKPQHEYLHEIRGVITHEMVHVWQHSGRNTCPGGLIEGIADYVRIKSGLGAVHWKKFPADEKSRGEKWDQGYERTAWFLEWVEDRCWRGVVGELNAVMAREEWRDGKLFEEITGKKVERWWEEYKAAWPHMKEE